MVHSDTSRGHQTDSYTLQKIAQCVDGALQGNKDFIITGVAPLDTARADQLSFWLEPKMEEAARASRAGALIVPVDQKIPGKNVIQVRHPRKAFAQILTLFAKKFQPAVGVHPTAVVEPSARIGKNVSVGPLSYIGEDVEIGEGTILYPSVTLLRGTRIGARVIIHSGTVIGSDGFGFNPAGSQWEKIPQIGCVVIEDDVEIQANCVIDRATMGETRIGKGTKIDNLVHIAHNVQIGPNCAITAQAGIAGSAVIGAHVVSGGQIGVAPGTRVGDNVEIAAQAGIASDIESNSRVAGFPAQDTKKEFKVIALARRLPEVVKRLADVEKKIAGKK